MMKCQEKPGGFGWSCRGKPDMQSPTFERLVLHGLAQIKEGKSRPVAELLDEL